MCESSKSSDKPLEYSIFEWKHLEIVDDGTQYELVTFKRDFGPWKAGQECEIIVINEVISRIQEYKKDSPEVIRECRIRLTDVMLD